MKMTDEACKRRAKFIRETTPQTPKAEFNAFYLGGGLSVVLLVCLVIGWLP